MRPRRLASHAALAALVPLLAMGAACGGAEPEEIVAAASGELREAGTARLDLLFTFDLATAEESFTMRGEGSIDYGNSRSAATFQLPGGIVEVIGNGRDVFLRAPKNPFVSDPATWLRVDASGAIENAEQALGVVSGTDPGALLENMQAAGDITEVGGEDVRGVSTTHYSAILDPDKALGQLTFLQRQQVDQFKSQGRKFALSVDAWIDDDGRPRRLRSVSEVEGVVTATFTMEFFDFDAGVDIVAPTSGEIGATQTAANTQQMFEIGQRIGAAASSAVVAPAPQG